MNPIGVQLDLESIKEIAHVPRGKEKRLLSLIAAAQSVVAAKAVYKVSYIDSKAEDSVTIDGVLFRSRVLRRHLDKIERVFPYVVTIGAGLDHMEKACADPVDQYYLDLIGNAAVVSAREQIRERIRSRYALQNLSYLGPGQLKDWPLEEQRSLFSVLGNVESAVGVLLSDSLLMIPRKSLSGIYFAAETAFFACELCPREQCSSRKAAYNKELAGEYLSL